jgi:gluconokinase
MDATTKTTNAVVVFDVGSSSLRCTLYQVSSKSNHHDLTVLSHASVVRRSVEPRDGSIVNVEGLLDDLEHLLDEVLRQWATTMDNATMTMLTVQAVGFSTFCMNLIGLDRSIGRVVATFSYASQSSSSCCPSTNVNEENDDDDADNDADNKPTDQQQMAEHLYQATGTYNGRHHPSYAPLHLRRYYYRSDRCSGTTTTTAPEDNTVEWHTIASYAYRRWFGSSSSSNRPIMTYGEASWTGLLNLHTCDYEPVVLNYITPPQPPSQQQQQQKCSDASLQLGLPALVPTNVPVGIWTKDTINETYYRRWPCLNGAQLFGGIPDGYAATIGSKCCGGGGGGGVVGGGIDTTPSSSSNDDTATVPVPVTVAAPMRIAVTMGTTAAARVVVDYPKKTKSSSTSQAAIPPFIVPSGLFAYRIDDKHVLLGGALNDGGSVLEWARELLNLGDDFDSPQFLQCINEAARILQERYRDLEDNDDDDDCERRPPTPSSRQHHLSMLPLLSGERSTGFRTNATGAMLGLTRDITPAHFLLSCMEGVVLRLHAIITLLRWTHDGATTSITTSTGTTTTTTIPPIIVISGKALETNPLWRQMLADCTGLSVVYDATTTEGTSRGVAKYMMMAAGYCYHNNNDDDDDLYYAMEELVESSRTDPNTTSAGADRYWQMAAARQQQLLDAVDPLFSGPQL